MRTITHQQSAENLLTALVSGELSASHMQEAFTELVSRPISAELLVQCARVLREKMITVDLSPDAIDTCGTGGSGKKKMNVSTLSAFLVAACGGKVAKHGNRSASGNCGSFDLLEELGVRIDLSPDEERCIFEKFGIVFLFAPLHHPSLRHVAPLRKSYGKKTLFNLLGPLCNPAKVHHQMIGTGNEEQAQMIAEAIQMLGTKLSFVVTGHDGLDEVTMTTSTTIRTVTERGITLSEFSPVLCVSEDEFIGGTPKENAEYFVELAKGGGTLARKNMILINAAHALLLTPLASSFDEALALATEKLSSGGVNDLFVRYRDLTQRPS